MATVRITFTRTFAAIVLGSGGNGLPARRKSPRGTLTEEERAKAGENFTSLGSFFFYDSKIHRSGKIVDNSYSVVKKFREPTNLSN